MFKRSLLMSLGLVVCVAASATITQMALTSDLPSSYDPNLPIEKAFKTSEAPLLIEFYSDTCGTCKQVAPRIHAIEGDYKNKLTLVMLDMDQPDNKNIAQLFGVDELPGVFIFDHHKMKKYQIQPTQ